MVPNQELPLIPYQKVLGLPQLCYFLPREFGSYHIFVHILQSRGYWGCYLGQSYEFFSCLEALVLAQNSDFLGVSPGSFLGALL